MQETGPDSLSNWTANENDKSHTLGAVLQFTPMRSQRLTTEIAYTYSISDGAVAFTSPVGTPLNDANPFEPVGFDQIDDVRLHVLNAHLRYAVTRNLAYTVGFLWEKFRYDDDLSTVGFVYIPVTALRVPIPPLRPLVSGLLATFMGTQPRSYNATVVYMSVRYTF
jgi:hypothetical protein